MNKILDYIEFEPVKKSDWEKQVKMDLNLEDISEITKYSSEKAGHGSQPYYDRSDLNGLEYLEGFHNFLSSNYSEWKNYTRLIVEDNIQLEKDIIACNSNGADGIILEIGDEFDTGRLNLKSLNPQIEVSLEFQNSPLTPGSLFPDTIKNPCGFVSGAQSNDILSPNGFRILELTVPNAPDPPEELGSLLHQAKYFIDQYEAEQNHLMVINKMFVKINVGKNFFEEISKIRALRIVFFAFAHSYGIAPGKIEPVYIFSTSNRYRDDDYGPHENMLKSTSGAMSAIIGGSSALWVEPEDNTSLSKRIALNVSSILKDESYMAKVADPSYGAYLVEKCTHEIAMEGWNLFLNKIKI